MTDDLSDLKHKLDAAAQSASAPPAAPARGVGDGMQLAIDLVLAVGVSLFIGIILDRYLHTTPWFTLIFLILGVAAGFRNFYLFARKLMRPDTQETTP